MKRLRYYFVIIPIVLSTCQPPAADLGVASDYFPEPSHLLSGVVNKYYHHLNPGEGQDAYTDIFYKSYQLTPLGELVVRNYNAGLEHTLTQRFRFQDSAMLLVQEITYAPIDTVQTVVSQSVFLSWKDTAALRLERQYTFPEVQRRANEQQTAVRDTTVLGRPAKVFEKTYNYRTVYRGDTSEATWTYEAVYAQGFGLWASTDQDYPGGTMRTELVEQMPRAEFERRAAHGRHRIAYIDPANTLDDVTDFQLCGLEKTIADYYNGTPDGHFAKGKRVMLDRIAAQMDTTRLGSESGYLTFRFVVNCRGEAGRFVTEQADIDFQAKQFNPQTVAHLYDIVYGLKDWSPTMIDGEARDAYFYLTFRLVDGKIVDILP